MDLNSDPDPQHWKKLLNISINVFYIKDLTKFCQNHGPFSRFKLPDDLLCSFLFQCLTSRASMWPCSLLWRKPSVMQRLVNDLKSDSEDIVAYHSYSFCLFRIFYALQVVSLRSCKFLYWYVRFAAILRSLRSFCFFIFYSKIFLDDIDSFVFMFMTLFVSLVCLVGDKKFILGSVFL
jgi:hypothetical protein